MIRDIANCVKEKLIVGISDLKDESDREGIRIVIELNKNIDEDVILNLLYKYTQLEISYGIINLVIVNSVPKIVNLYELISLYVLNRVDITKKKVIYELNISKNKVHILNGLKKASLDIHTIINIIRNEIDINNIKEALKSKYDLDDDQVKSILEIKLQKLTKIETNKIIEEIDTQNKKINEYTSILSSEDKIYSIIKEELLDLKNKYGDQRRSIISSDIKVLTNKNDEDIIPNEDILITITNNGYIKRLPVSTYTKQNRGGKGIIGIEVNSKDFVKNIFVASTHDHILFFTNKGKVYSKKGYEIPESNRVSKGRSIVNLLNLSNDENIVTMLPIKKFGDLSSYLVFSTRNGLIKKTSLFKFKNIRSNGIISVLLNDNDELVSVKKTNGNNKIIIVTSNGKACCIHESEIRPMNRISRGVIGIKLSKIDFVVNMEIINENDTLLTITKNGFGKRTKYSEYIPKHRGSIGVKTIITNERNGLVSSILSVSENDELIIISSYGIIIRVEVSKISCLGRNTQGVKIMKLKEGDFISSVVKI